MVSFTTLLTVLTIASTQYAFAAPTSTTTLEISCVCGGNNSLNLASTKQLCSEASQDDPEIASIGSNGQCVFKGAVLDSATDRAGIVEGFKMGCAMFNEKCSDAKVELKTSAPVHNGGRAFKNLPVMGNKKFDM